MSTLSHEEIGRSHGEKRDYAALQTSFTHYIVTPQPGVINRLITASAMQ